MASSRKAAPDSAVRSDPAPSASRRALTERVAACLQRHFPAGGRLVVGYSGGLDSTVLLHVLAALRGPLGFTLSALHVHHGLSANADAWAAHCRRTCAGLEVPLRVERVAVTRAGAGPEAAARAARYAAFAALDADGLALAHQRDDQAETVLLQLLRGGGPRGLAAMPEARALGSGGPRLIRPLLDMSRAELEAWGREHGLAWIEDESNRHTHLARNALRQEILPRLGQHFPDAVPALARAAAQFAEAAALLDALADLDAGAPGELEVRHLAALPEARARNLLRRRLEAAGASLSQDGLREALRQILTARADARLQALFGEVALYRYQGRVYFVRPPRAAGAVTGKRWRGEAALDLGAAGTVRFEPAAGGGLRLGARPVSVRFRAGGERFRPAAGRPRRALKDLLRESGVPPWQRDRIPLLYVGDRLAWVAAIGADVECLAGPGEDGWRVTWTPAELTWPE